MWVSASTERDRVPTPPATRKPPGTLSATLSMAPKALSVTASAPPLMPSKAPETRSKPEDATVRSTTPLIHLRIATLDERVSCESCSSSSLMGGMMERVPARGLVWFRWAPSSVILGVAWAWPL